ncbi:MAG: NAD(P)-dependent oxidoreductase, partial [Xanthobacteraceae bacterium]
RLVRLVSYFSPAQTIAANAQVELVRADLRDAANWSSLLTDAEAVVHLSWRTNLRAAEADPAGDRQLNVEPVQALVRAAERCSQPVPVTFASTVTIVGDAPPIPADERTPDRPCTVYDRHKLESEIILRDATRRGVLNACSLRLPNVYGYGSGVRSTNSNRGILNEIMRRAVLGEALTIYGKGEYVRDFTFIGDVVDAFCRALSSERVRNGGYYVVASGEGCTLAKAFELVAREALGFTGRAVEIRHVPEPPDLFPIERRNFVGDSSLFQKSTGWYPQFDLQIGIRDYFERAITPLESGPAPDEAA